MRIPKAQLETTFHRLLGRDMQTIFFPIVPQHFIEPSDLLARFGGQVIAEIIVAVTSAVCGQSQTERSLVAFETLGGECDA